MSVEWITLLREGLSIEAEVALCRHFLSCNEWNECIWSKFWGGGKLQLTYHLPEYAPMKEVWNRQPKVSQCCDIFDSSFTTSFVTTKHFITFSVYWCNFSVCRCWISLLSNLHRFCGWCWVFTFALPMVTGASSSAAEMSTKRSGDWRWIASPGNKWWPCPCQTHPTWQSLPHMSQSNDAVELAIEG